jgi:2-polyprenyl-3-methyl-5-hydroxy-6-metoxy-1,4-benzoquinol methylase
MPSDETLKVIAQVQEKYGVGKNFATFFLEKWLTASEFTQEQFQNSLREPTARMWFDFAISTNERGRHLAKLIKPHLNANATRYLDAGCGYGGFLIGFLELGLDVYGFDFDPRLVGFSKINIKDFNLSEDRVQVGDLQDRDLINRLGKFDAITCNDVLEHVSDASLSMEYLVEMLSESGVLTIQVPNKDFVGFVSHDSHYYLFGLAFLKHDQAKEYYKYFFTEEYSVGEYHELNYYLRKLRSLGCETSVNIPFQKRKQEGIQLVFQSAPDFLKFLKQPNPPWRIKLTIAAKYIQYMLRLGFHGVLSLVFSSERDYFKQTYLADSWVIIAKRK